MTINWGKVTLNSRRLCEKLVEAGKLTEAELNIALSEYNRKKQQTPDLELLEFLTMFIGQHEGRPQFEATMAPQQLETIDLGEPNFFETMNPKDGFSAEQRSTPNLRYRDAKELGRGGMGKVVLSVDKMFGRSVARKFSLDPTSEALFLREAKITGYLDHPNIVPVHEIGEEDSEMYFTMKAIKGQDLSKLIEKQRKLKFGGKNLNELLQIFVKVCDAMSYAHSKNVVHRDLKPGNVMVGEFGEVYVTDWGLAKHLDEEEPDVPAAISDDVYKTMDGTIKGSPPYMPPEQIKGKADKQSDIYCMGAILYELLTSQRFRTFKKGSNIAQILKAIITDKGFVGFVKPRKANPELPKPLESIILTAVEPKPKHRYETVEELRDDVKAFLAGEKVSVHSYSLGERARKWFDKHSTLAATVSVATLVGLLGLAGYGVMSARAERLERDKQATELEAARLEKEKAQEEQARLKAESEKTKVEAEKAVAEREKAKAETAQKESELKATQAEAALSETLKAQLEKVQKRNSAQVFYWQAEELVKRRGNLEQAVELFSKAIETDPEFGDAYYARGLAKYSNLEATLALEDFAKADELSLKTTKEHDVRTLFYQGIVYIDLLEGNLQEGIKFLQQVVEHSKNVDNAYLLLANSLISFTNKEYEKAIELAQKAHNAFPTMWEALYILSMYHSEGCGSPFDTFGLRNFRDFPKALAYLNKALEINPSQVRCLIHRIKLYGITAQFEKSIQDADTLINMLPNVAVFYTMRGYALFNAGKNEASINDFDKSMKLSQKPIPDNYAYKSFALHNLGRLSEAEENITTALKLTQDPGYYINRALIRKDLGKLKEAFDDVETGLRLSPHDALGYLIRGSCYETQGDVEKAVQDYEKTIQLKASLGYLYLGKLYAKTGEKEKAIRALKSYIECNNLYRQEEAKQLLKKLEKQK